jgi:hypothetical protein
MLFLRRRLWLLISSFLGRFICHVGVCCREGVRGSTVVAN